MNHRMVLLGAMAALGGLSGSSMRELEEAERVGHFKRVAITPHRYVRTTLTHSTVGYGLFSERRGEVVIGVTQVGEGSYRVNTLAVGSTKLTAATKVYQFTSTVEQIQYKQVIQYIYITAGTGLKRSLYSTAFGEQKGGLFATLLNQQAEALPNLLEQILSQVTLQTQ